MDTDMKKENNKDQGDKLYMLGQLMTLGNHTWIIKCLSTFSILFIEIHTLVALKVAIAAGWRDYLQLTAVCLVQPGCAGLCAWAYHSDRLVDGVAQMRNVAKQLTTENKNFEEMFDNKARNGYIVTYTLTFGTLFAHGIFSHYLCRGNDVNLFLWFIDEYYEGVFRHFMFTVSTVCLLLAGIGTVFPVYYMTYISFNMQFNFFWLFQYIRHNLTKPLPASSCMFNEYYQNNTYYTLKQVAKHHLKFKDFDDARRIENSVIFMLCCGALFMGVSTVYFLLAEPAVQYCEVILPSFQILITILILFGFMGHVPELFIPNVSSESVANIIKCCTGVVNANPAYNIRMGIALVIVVAIVLELSTNSQRITDVTSRLFDLLYETPWIYWNIQNQRMLMIIMYGAAQPWELTCYNLFPLNHNFITDASKLVYSMGAAISKFN